MLEKQRRSYSITLKLVGKKKKKTQQHSCLNKSQCSKMIQLPQFYITCFCNTSLLICINQTHLTDKNTIKKNPNNQTTQNYNKIVVVWEKRNKAKAREQSKREQVPSLL